MVNVHKYLACTTLLMALSASFMVSLVVAKSLAWDKTAQITAFKQTHDVNQMRRDEVIRALGEPTLSVKIMPRTNNETTVDEYQLSSANNEEWRITYNKDDTARSATVSPTPCATLLRFAGSPTVSEKRIENFLGLGRNIAAMTQTLIEKELGAPGQTWKESSNIGHRPRQWVQLAYYYPDGRRALLLTLDASNSKVYMWAIHTVSSPLPPPK